MSETTDTPMPPENTLTLTLEDGPTEIEVKKIEELDPNKLYHIAVAPDAGQALIRRFAEAVRLLDIKALITRSEVKFEAFIDMFDRLPKETKNHILEILKRDSQTLTDEEKSSIP